MIRIYAPSVSAKMIQVQSLRDRTKCEFIRKPMGEDRPARTKVQLAVSGLCDIARPSPAVPGFIDLGPKVAIDVVLLAVGLIGAPMTAEPARPSIIGLKSRPATFASERPQTSHQSMVLDICSKQENTPWQ